MCDKGYGIKSNLHTAYKFYIKAGDRGYADAQYILGSKCNLIDEDSNKSFEWYIKAADQGHAAAQLRLALMYGIGGETVKQDLAQSLKWFLESCKSHFFNPEPYPKEFIDFIPLTLTPENEIKLIADQNTLKDNIRVFLGFHDTEKGTNNPDSHFEKHEWTVLDLVKNDQEIIDFKGALLKAFGGFQQSGFMVNCLKVKDKDIETFKSSHSTDIKYYKFQGQSFLTFGQDNIKMANQLIDVLMNVDKIHPVYGQISHILTILNEVQQSFQSGSPSESSLSDEAKALIEQYESRVRSELENQSSNETNDLTFNGKLTDKVSEAIKTLEQLQVIPQQLQYLLIEGAAIRNKLFLQSNERIEPIFKD